MVLPEMIDTLINGRYGEQARFLLAGVVNTLFGYSLFALGLWILTPAFTPLAALTGEGVHTRAFIWVGQHSYLLIQWLTWALSVPFGAFTLKYFAFRASGPYWSQALRSYVVYLPAQFVASGCLALFTIVFGLPPLIAQIGAVFFSTIISYLGHKFFTFRAS